MEFLSSLNSKQREAVLNTEGPLLILAGAGSGKTNALTHRIAYLINEKNIFPSNILAITFTNKAAREMKERVQKKVSHGFERIWIGTFHAICMRILRSDIEKIGFQNNFVVYDTADQKTLITECIKRCALNDKNFPVKSVLSEIGKAKDDMIEPSRYQKIYQGDYRLEHIGKVYQLYQEELFKNNALDFDDIILKTILLLSTHPEVLSYYQNKFSYIHVDEYQDTNNAQYTLISLLAGKHQNLCVVGDDDQSIYGWRGANIQNILNFEKEFPNCKVIKLEQNYRSSSIILNAANEIIQNNAQRKSKQLWTDNGEGERIHLFTGRDEKEEAFFVANKIKSIIKNESISLSDITILYRTNAQSRNFEDIFMQENIPYKIVGGLRYYDRKEIKDLVAYLRVITNPSDAISLQRIINVPKRGIGNTTIEHIQSAAAEFQEPILNILRKTHEIPALKRTANKLQLFSEMMDTLINKVPTMPLPEAVEWVLDVTGLLNELEDDKKNDNLTRIENLKEFITLAKEFNAQNPDLHLSEFLERISLSSDTDSMEEETDQVLLLTLHSAKGLEFPIVFMVGMEEGVFPSYRSMDQETLLEEERRLCYVGVTRAMKQLYLTHVFSRTLYGNTTYNRPSRFLAEIPDTYIEKISLSTSSPSQTNRTGHAINADSFGSIHGYAQVPPHGIRPFSTSTIPQPPKLSKNLFQVGDVVHHKKFGIGSIVAISPEKDDLKLDILFENSGKKSLMANYSQLTRERS